MRHPHRDRTLPAQSTGSGAASRSRLRGPHTATSGGRTRTAAQGIVAALTLPAPPTPSPRPARPLPVISLHELPRDTSMLYDIGLVDPSGRIGNRDIVDALRWRPGDKLETILTQGAIVIRLSAGGLFSVPQRRRIVIPAEARHRHGIRPGDHVLVAAAPDYGIVIVYPLSVLDEMITRYHSAHSDTEYHGHD